MSLVLTSPVPPPRRVRRRLAIAALVLWLVAGTALGGVLLVRHLVALPAPPIADRGLRDAVVATLPDAHWRALHIMYRACPCSRRTVDHLVSRGRADGIDELVLMVDDAGAAGPEESRLRDAGYAVRVITPDTLHRTYHVEAAPLLVIASPAGELAYVGGYNRRKQSQGFDDVRILADLMASDAAVARPVFGCATSARLANALDPLGLAQGRPR
jgi:hypothetical protein